MTKLLGDVVLDMRGVRKRFGKNEVLKGVDLTLQRHEVVCLIGASGSGKSTLLRCCNMLERIDQGSIEVLGTELASPRINEDLVRRHIGIVFQSFNLFPHLSVLKNVTLAPRRVLRTPKGHAERAARELLGRIGLAEKAGDYPDRLSGGQQQRVAIVRCLAMDPSLLLLDEITSALDPERVGEVLHVVRDLASASRMSMLIVTHEIQFACDIADRAQIIEKGPPGEVLKDPRHSRTRQFLRAVLER